MYRWVGYVGNTAWLSLVMPWVKLHVSITVIRALAFSVRGTDLAAASLMCWVFSWWRCHRGASLFKSWCIGAAPKAGGAGSGSSLLWILSKLQDCSKALDWLEYSLVDMPPAARQSHDLHLTVPIIAIWLKPFLLSFSSCLCFSLCGFDPGVHLACCGFPVWEK